MSYEVGSSVFLYQFRNSKIIVKMYLVGIHLSVSNRLFN